MVVEGREAVHGNQRRKEREGERRCRAPIFLPKGVRKTMSSKKNGTHSTRPGKNGSLCDIALSVVSQLYPPPVQFFVMKKDAPSIASSPFVGGSIHQSWDHFSSPTSSMHTVYPGYNNDAPIEGCKTYSIWMCANRLQRYHKECTVLYSSEKIVLLKLKLCL